MIIQQWRSIVVAVLCGLASQAQAALTIDITGGDASAIPVAISPFDGAGSQYSVIADVVGSDLLHSGELKLVNMSDLVPPIEVPSDPRFVLAKNRGAEAVVLGQVSSLSNSQIGVQFRLMDAVQNTQLAGYSYTANPIDLRTIAHKIADVVYQKLTGTSGYFSSHLAYVLKTGNTFRLEVADSDGQNAQTVLKSIQPIMSPAWSQDGSKMAYVSFENNRAVVYEQSMSTGKRFVLANFPGSNSAPAWSPDGNRLALVLTRDGGSQLYMMNADGSGLKRLSFGGGIDTEPNWSPDGQSLLFTSDRDGSPQVYQMSVNGGAATRLTFGSRYNVSPRWSPDGKSFVYVQRDQGAYHIAVMTVSGGQVQILTQGNNDESPSFAPNGKMILYATGLGDRGALAVVSVDGKTHERLSNGAGSLEFPVWGH